MPLVHAAMSARYLTALRAHLRRRRADTGGHGETVGRAALARGVRSIDLAVMHAQAIVALAPKHNFGETRNGSLRRAGVFFTQALIPIEAARCAARETDRDLQQRSETMRRHTAELIKGNRRFERESARRKAGEVVIRKSEKDYRALFLESQVMQKKLRLLTRQIIAAQEEERKHISRELHDEVVQTLVGINVELSALVAGASIGLRTLKAKVAHAQKLVEQSVKTVHRFARELRPAVLDDLGLIPALHAYSKNLAARRKMVIRMTAFGGVEALAAAKRTVLFRVAQEALTNVARHANATVVNTCISELPGKILMEISDNGQSFPVEKTLLAQNPKRLGLIGMKERVEMVGGSLTILSVAGRGTTVRAEIPFTSDKTKT
jgi:signal transduction histidine kinase